MYLYISHNVSCPPPKSFGNTSCSHHFVIGSILINYLADRQRQQFRDKNGVVHIWGSKPIVIESSYETQEGEKKITLLLASGYWGISRHFHYIPELSSAFFWSLTALFTNFLRYFYVIFLAILLGDRAFRHDKRCRDKYGKYWDEYRKKVPYSIIPYVF